MNICCYSIALATMSIFTDSTKQSRTLISDEYLDKNKHINERITEIPLNKAPEEFEDSTHTNNRTRDLTKEYINIKKSLDKYAMKRRLTHFNLLSDTTGTAERSIKNEDIEENNPKPTTSKDFNTKRPFYEDPRVFNALKTQTDLLQKFIKVIDDEKNIIRSYAQDFSELLQDLDKKPVDVKDKYNSSDYRITTAAVKAPELPDGAIKESEHPKPVIQMTFDRITLLETLKRDPLVRRIIAMSKLKREEFFEKLKTLTPRFSLKMSTPKIQTVEI